MATADREVLRELRDAARAHLRAERDGLTRLATALARADARLGQPEPREALCDCRSRHGFHSPTCALLRREGSIS